MSSTSTNKKNTSSYWDKYDDYEECYLRNNCIKIYLEKLDEDYDNKWHPNGKVNYFSPDARKERSLGFTTFWLYFGLNI